MEILQREVLKENSQERKVELRACSVFKIMGLKSVSIVAMQLEGN